MDEQHLEQDCADYLTAKTPEYPLPHGTAESPASPDLDSFFAGLHDNGFDFLDLSKVDDQPSRRSFLGTDTSSFDTASSLTGLSLFPTGMTPLPPPCNNTYQTMPALRRAQDSIEERDCQENADSSNRGYHISCTNVDSHSSLRLALDYDLESGLETIIDTNSHQSPTLPFDNVSSIAHLSSQIAEPTQAFSTTATTVENVASAPLERHNTGIPSKAGTRFSRESVQILKTWLLVNKYHPYPTEEEKLMLQLQTGLTKTQVSNWLTNARRRKAQQKTSTPPHTDRSASINIPHRPGTPAFEGNMHDMDPLTRWVDSPPESEPVSAIAIARAIAADRRNSCGPDRPSYLERLSGSSRGSHYDLSSASSAGTSSETSYASVGSQTSDDFFGASASRRKEQSYRRRRRRPVRRRERYLSTSSSLRPYQCTFCAETFRTKHDWQRHEKSLHLSLEKWTCTAHGPRVVNPRTKHICCVFCGKVDPDDAHIETHNHTTCNVRSLEEKSFCRKDHLNQHLKLVHNVQFLDWSMNDWKLTNIEVRSRCGFCGIEMTSWPIRIEHLAEHFKGGSTISDWKGDWGFEPSILNMLENAIPPYLIEMERISPFPFVASCGPTDSPRTAYELITLELDYYIVNYQAEMSDLPASEDLQLEACRIIYASEVLSKKGISGESSWLRDLLMVSKDIARQAQFAALRRNVENKLCVLKINGKDNLFEQCPFELQLLDFARDRASLNIPITDKDLQQEVCSIISRAEKISAISSTLIIGFFVRLAMSSTSWLSDFRHRASLPGSPGLNDPPYSDSVAMMTQENPPWQLSPINQSHSTRSPRAFEALMKNTFFLNDANCYRHLAQELTRFVWSNAEIQHQARWILFDCDDPWNQTAADNDEWLQRFKKDVGILNSGVD
ncbi:c2h2 type zinc finger containing [Fusarium sporotrichioides]|uniref:C2h2 type zinc finger containing n=1 Tax=Fusarium sporotrichioides TaxID=5514 RepID=A0A395RUD7_FUSSP|nr:c2h2 type zinc finger containing [Fusarium sporotrichioides]